MLHAAIRLKKKIDCPCLLKEDSASKAPRSDPILSGEFVGFFGGANILMEYVLSNAAVARSFTDYLASTFGVTEHNAWRIVVDGIADGYNALDVPAVALILLITVCLCYR